MAGGVFSSRDKLTLFSSECSENSSRDAGYISSPKTLSGHHLLFWAPAKTLNGHHLPFWAPGSGYYGQTLGQCYKQITDDATDLVLKHLDTVPVNDDGIFTVADYGTNDGSCSMTLMGRIIGQLRRKHGEKLPIQVIYEDQEKNDFNSLFRGLSDGPNYLSEYSNVYPFATNVNFYKQCVPDGTCDVIYTSIATEWLENPYVNLKDCLFHEMADPESTELRHFLAKAEKDWIKFLLLRAKELKKGGLLVVLSPGSAEEFQAGSFTLGEEEKADKTEKSPISMLGTTGVDIKFDLDMIWKQFKQENIITQEEYETCFVPVMTRKPKENTAPFEAPSSPVVEAGLSLVHYDQVFHNIVFKELWRGVDDRAYFAELITKAYMVPLRTSFSSNLSDSRSAEDKEAIVNELFKRFQARVAARDPETYRDGYIVNRLIARKI